MVRHGLPRRDLDLDAFDTRHAWGSLDLTREQARRLQNDSQRRPTCHDHDIEPAIVKRRGRGNERPVAVLP